MNSNAKAAVRLALCLTALPGFQIHALAQASTPAVVIVHVYNNAGVSEEMLAEAGMYVQELFNQIGVEALWLDSESRLQTGSKEFLANPWSDDKLHVSVNIVSKPVPGTPFHLGDRRVMGFTPLAHGATRSYVFYDRVNAFVEVQRWKLPFLKVSRLLGYAVAHEMGHLLIPNDGSHSSSGLMQAWLYDEDLEKISWGNLLFTNKEGQWIRDEVQRRVNRPTAISVANPTAR